MDVSIICPDASRLVANAVMIWVEAPARRQRTKRSVGTKTVRQVPPRRAGPQHPKDAVEDTAVVHPRATPPALFGSIDLVRESHRPITALSERSSLPGAGRSGIK